MVETGENQEIKKEIKEQTPSQNQDKEDVNFLIQKKCQENQIGEEEQKNITTFFKNIKNKLPKEYQNDLLDYIKNINGNDFFLLSMASDSEKVIEEKKIIDQIDLKQRQSIIDTYSEIEGKKSEIEGKKSEIEGKKSEIEGKKSEIEGKKSEIETEEKIDEETKQLLEQAQKDYENLPNKYKLNKDNKEDQEKLKKQKEILEKDKTLNKLKDKGFSEDQINDYVSLNYTYSNHKEELKDTEFAKSYEKLENKLFPKRGIVKSEDFKGENAINTTNSIIDNNPKINNYVQQINGGSSNYQEKSKEIKKLNNNEIKEEFDKEKNQELFNKYKTLLPQEPKEDENKTTEENLQEKTKRQRNILLEINNLEEQTQSTIQKRVFGSTISGLTSFFDFSIAQKEHLSVIASDSVAIHIFNLT
ncbi:MAG: hypothetical protein PHR61_02555 [Candidatus Absconditabacteria bacterium]|nr:hypothetical protein [Candidatus Absconditabacteria bacterium]